LKKAGLTLKDLNIKEIATADTVAVFSDSSVPVVATYEPFMSQAVKNLPQRKPRILISSKDYPGIIIDIIAARNDDLKANPEKYRKFLRGVYKAVDYYKTNPADFIKLAAPHFNLSEPDVKDILDTSLIYTDYKMTSDYIGAPGKPGKLYEIFDTVMQLNLENGAAETKLDPAQQIDPDGPGNQIAPRLAATADGRVDVAYLWDTSGTGVVSATTASAAAPLPGATAEASCGQVWMVSLTSNSDATSSAS
jgi:NitT/TauT family transport system substrate-binding protein